MIDSIKFHFKNDESNDVSGINIKSKDVLNKNDIRFTFELFKLLNDKMK
ncbi:hypothetical protein [Wocania ichthyoenteri]|nr:hypothetical protein [Wocania ichthyoenteri]